MKQHLKRVQHHARQKPIIAACLGVVGLIIFGQLLYPNDRLLPFSSIDTLATGGWQKEDATWELDSKLNAAPIDIQLASTSKTYRQASPAEIGLRIDNTERVEAASYPLFARFIPSSVLWYQLVQSPAPPSYERDKTVAENYVKKTLGDCTLAPKNASIMFKADKLEVVPAADGGSCDREEVLKAISATKPTLQKPGDIEIEATITPPKLGDDDARRAIAQLESRVAEGVELTVGQTTRTIPAKTVFSWLKVSVKKDAYVFSFDTKLSNAYFAKEVTKLVAKPAGTTRVTTRDFTELSRKNGATGRTLNTEATRQDILQILSGKATKSSAVTTSVAPKIVYTRSYTKTALGIGALMTHYAADNPGSFGVSFQEIGGQGRGAEVNQHTMFTTASTYKLFVAFSTLKRVDSGKLKWSQQIEGGRNLASCFDDMIVKSDNPCAEALIEKIGRAALDADLRSIGLTESTFRASSNQTNAAELRVFLTKLQQSDLPLKSASREKLLAAMKRQVYRQGVPAGAAGPVADKVGFLEGLLHDAAIVYAPNGTYVLVILTDGSSWANIAELTRKIEALR